jgi:PAS domain S-box-containing protein
MTDFSIERYFSDAEALLSLFLSDMDEMILVLNQDGNIRVCNTAATAFLKKQYGETVKAGSALSDLALCPKHKRNMEKAYADVFNGRATEIEVATLVDGLPATFCYKMRPGKRTDGTIVAVIITIYDITKKKAVENALQESEQRLRYALDGSNLATWDWNIKTGHVFFSPSWKRLLGFEEHEIEDHIYEWEKRIHPDDKEQLQQVLKNHFGSGQGQFENEYRLQTKNKTYKWFLARGTIVERAPDGTPLRMIGTHTDITGKLESEVQYRNLFEINPLPTWIYDYNTLQFMAVNKVAEQHYGYTKGEFLGMTILDIQPAEQLPLMQERLGNREKGVVDTYPFWKHKKKNGALFIAEINSTTIQYNGRKARLVIINDITNKVKAEEALKQSYLQFQYVSKATSDAIYEWDIDNNQLNWGEGMTALFGHQSHEVSFSGWEARIHPEDRDTVSDSLRQAVYHSCQEFWNMEYRFLKSDDTYRFVVEKGCIVRDSDGTPKRMIGAMQDITNFKQKELELAESNKRYEYATLAISDIIWDWTIEKNSVLCSHNYEKMLGWKLPENKCLSIKTCIERFHQSDRTRIWNSIMEAVKNKDRNTWDAECKLLKADGRVAQVYNRGYILRNEYGKAIRMIGAMQDITDRKMLEEQLLQKELDKQRVISKATIDTQERERSEIGKELHDNVNQVLTTTKLYLELARSDAALKDELIKKSEANIQYVINEIRQLSRSLMNPSLGDLGLIDSIQDLIENIKATRKLNVVLEAPASVEAALPENLGLTIYRIIQEGLNNAVKHARATTVYLSLEKLEDGIRLIIKDDGIGFNKENIKKGTGLKSIQNRVYLTHGTLQIDSAPGIGCTLTIHFKT